MLGTVATKALQEFCARQLSHREAVRVGAVIELAIHRMQQRLLGGEIPRQDGFFSQDVTGRSPADEVLEGVLLRAKNESEEKKALFLANIITSVAFDPSISLERANFLIKLAEQLTYRQFCYVALVGRLGTLNVERLRRDVHQDIELEVLKREEMDLHSSDLGTFGLILGSGPWDDALSPVGSSFYSGLRLSEIPSSDLKKVSELLRKAGCSVELPE